MTADVETAPQTRFILVPDGTRLACHSLGEGPAVLLLHGFLSSARLNWFDSGVAAAIAAAGFRVIAPDLRGHGESGAPPDAACYPVDVLPADAQSVLDALGIRDYALVGYSLGARTAARMLARGAQPRRLVLAGMGDSGVLDVGTRQAHFEDAIRRGKDAANPVVGAFIQDFMRANGVAAGPALHVLASQTDTPPHALAAIACPTLVLCGARDRDNGDSAALARLIPGARHATTPGDHLSAVGKAEFREVLTGFLREDLGAGG
jgi:pimeloyl-ACP methyl ester carboxylesterase